MRLSWIIPFKKRATRKAWYAATLGFAFLCGGKELQAQPHTTWLWANNAVGAEVASRCAAPETDPSGNAYVVGSFRSTNDPLTFSNSTTSLSDFNPDVFTIFMAKYNKDGNLVWAKSFKSGMADGELISVDAAGNIYCTGAYRDSIRIDNTVLNGSSSQYTHFLAKFTTTGNLVWAKNITSAAPGFYMDYSALKVDAANGILMTGSFNQSSLLLNGIMLNNSDASATSYDYFVTRFDANGNAVWASSGGSPDKHDFGASLCTGLQGTFYAGTMYLDTGVVINGGQIKVYKYNNAGTVAWAETINATSGALLGGLTCDGKGDLYLTGTYSGSIGLDSLTLDEDGGGCFVAKYNQNGNAVWARSSKSNATDISVFTTGIGVDQSGTVSVSGSYVYSFLTPVSKVTFDTTTLTLQGNRDAFLVQYNNNGNVVKALNIGGMNSDFGSGLCVQQDGSIYYTGSFYSPTLTLDSTQLTNAPNSSGNYYGKFFLAKYGARTVTGIDRIVDDTWLRVYPNPAKDYVTIDAAVPVKAIKMVDQLGRQVFYDIMPVNTRHRKLNTSQHAKGLYYVHVYASDGYVVKTLTLN